MRLCDYFHVFTNSSSVWRWQARGEGLRRRLWLPLPDPRRAARAAHRGAVSQRLPVTACRVARAASCETWPGRRCGRGRATWPPRLGAGCGAPVSHRFILLCCEPTDCWCARCRSKPESRAATVRPASTLTPTAPSFSACCTFHERSSKKSMHAHGRPTARQMRSRCGFFPPGNISAAPHPAPTVHQYQQSLAGREKAIRATGNAACLIGRGNRPRDVAAFECLKIFRRSQSFRS